MDIIHEIINRDFTLIHAYKFSGSYHHWHQRIEVVYIKKGNCTVNIAKKEYKAKAGDIIFIHSGEIHSYSSCSDDMHSLLLTFNPSLIQLMKSDMVFIKNHITKKMMSDLSLTKTITDIFDEMYSEHNQTLPFYENIIICDLIKLYSLLARNFQNDDVSIIKNLSKFEAFQETVNFIASNYTEKITLKDIAEKINYCEAYVSTMFVSFTGVNFKTYIDTIRIKHAVDLLKKTDKTIAHIAADCGYENLKTFNNTFKRITNQTPSEFREKNI